MNKKSILFRISYTLFLILLVSQQLYCQIMPEVLQQWKAANFPCSFTGVYYSVLGSVWNDQQISLGLSEQIQTHAGIYNDTYAKVTRRFNPDKWDADSVVEFKQNVLHNIGNWLDRNGEAISGTSPNPFHISFDWGAITSRNDKLYLHVMSQPKDGIIMLSGLEGKIIKACILGDGTLCKYHKDSQGVTVKLPSSVIPEQQFKVVEISFKGHYTVPLINIIPLTTNLIHDQHNAFKYYSNSGIDYNSRYQSTIQETWTLRADAMTVLLNGYTLVLHNNPFKKESMQDVILLVLLEGKYQL